MFYRAQKNGLALFVRLIPKAAKDAIAGVETAADGKVYLAVRVRAVPEDGKANKALIKFLAGEMKIPVSAFSIFSGATARFKQVHIAGETASSPKMVNFLNKVKV